MSTSTMASTAPPRLMSGRAACRILGCNGYGLLRYVAAGQLRTVVEPGRNLRYIEADVVRLAQERAAAEAGPAS